MFSSSTTSPGAALAASKSAASFTGRPSRPERWAATGARENFSSTTPSVGRPRCESRTTPAPLSSAMRMPGRAARIRLSLVMRPSFMGTLRSWRMTTVLPLHSMSCNSLMGMSASFLSGKRSPGRAGTRRPVCQKDMFPEEESPARPQRSKRMPLAEYPATAVPPPDGRTAWCDVLRRISVCSEYRARQEDTARHLLGVGASKVMFVPLLAAGHGCGLSRPRPPAWNLSSLGRTQKGPGPGDMSSRDPGPWFHAFGEGALKHRPLSATAHVSP